MGSKMVSVFMLVALLFTGPVGYSSGRPVYFSAPYRAAETPALNLDPAGSFQQSQMPLLAQGKISPASTDAAILFCPGTGTAEANAAQRGIRFTVSSAFRGVEVRLAAFPVGDFVIKAELRRGTGFITTPIASATIFIPIENVSGNHPYLPHAFNFGAVSVSGTETFTVKLIVLQGPGPVFIETFGTSTPCDGCSLTADVTSSNPSTVGDPAGFKVVDYVYIPPFGAPEIDGEIGYGEWGEYSAIPFSGGFIAMQRDFSRLYFLIDVTGDTYNNTAYDEDYFFLSFDADGDSAISPYRDINFTIDSNNNMRRQYYLGEADWGEFFGSNSSRGKNFRCESEDGTYTLTSYIPLKWNCTKHRIWEVAIDLHDIEAREGSTVHMGFMVASANPGIIERHPEYFAVDFTDLYVINIPHTPFPHNDATGVWLDSKPLEVTQAIQDRDNTLPLVQDKATVVRAYGSAWYVQERQLLYAYLFGKRDGVDLPGSPLRVVFDAPVETTWWRIRLEDSANFLLPKSWASGTIELRTYMTTTNFSSGESSYDPLTITFNKRATPTYWYIRINQGNDEYEALQSSETIYAYREYLETVFPVASVNWNEKSWENLGYLATKDEFKPALNKYYATLLLTWLMALSVGNPAPFDMPSQLYGFPFYSTGGSSDPIWAGGAGFVAYGYNGTSQIGTMAHEITHNLDKDTSGTWGHHVPFDCGAPGIDPDWPYLDDNIQEVGFDTRKPWENVTENTVLWETMPDIMSYCKEIGSPPKWVSPYRWQKWYDYFAPTVTHGPEQVVEDITQTYYLIGRIKPDGSGSLETAVTQPGIANTSIAGGEGSLEILDAFEGVLYTHTFPVFFEEQPDLTVDPLDFFFMLPVQTGAKKINLMYNDELLDQILISDHAPTVTLLSPNGGESWGEAEQTVTWSAYDEDDDPLTFILQYSPDNGVSWFPASGYASGTSVTVYPAQWKAGEQAILRILASDGVNTAEDTSDSVFTVGAKPPLVNIFKPAQDYWVLPGETISLSGYASDLEDQMLPEENYVWVEGDEVLGTGPELSAILAAGVHTIRLYVTDSDENTGWAETQVAVVYRMFMPVIMK